MSYVAGCRSSWLHGLAIRIGYEVCDWQVASRVRYEAVWLSSGIPGVCCYVGVAKIWDEAMWLVREGFAAFSYLGCMDL